MEGKRKEWEIDRERKREQDEQRGKNNGRKRET